MPKQVKTMKKVYDTEDVHSQKQKDCLGRYPYTPQPNNGGQAKAMDTHHITEKRRKMTNDTIYLIFYVNILDVLKIRNLEILYTLLYAS